MEDLAAQEIVIGIDSLCKIIPNIQILLVPIITTGFNLEEKNSFNLKSFLVTLDYGKYLSPQMQRQKSYTHKMMKLIQLLMFQTGLFLHKIS